MAKGNIVLRTQFKVVVNGRRNGNFRRHVIEDGQNRTICGLSMKKGHAFVLSSKHANCRRCLELLDKRFNEE